MTLLQEIAPDAVQNGGWIVAAITAGAGVVKLAYDYYKNRDNNSTTLKLTEQEKQNRDKSEIEKQNVVLMDKIDELERSISDLTHRLDKFMTVFKMIEPIIEESVANNPVNKKIVDEAYIHLKQNR